MRLGYFDEPQREYVILDPRTPVKWINYIGTRQFGGFVDHTGGALICKDDPTFNRITKYIQQTPASDFKGETLYLRLPAEAGYRVVSPFFVPGLEPFDRFECRIGLGYTHLLSEVHGLRTEATIFVPRVLPCEIRDIRITNLRDRPVEVDAIPVVEYTHPDALRQLTDGDWAPQTMVCRGGGDGPFTVVLQYPFMLRDTRVNYFTSSLPASSYETDRSRFLGENEYGTFGTPQSLLQPELSGLDSPRGNNLSALLHHLGIIAPGETCRLILQLGQAANLLAARHAIDAYRHEAVVDDAFAALREFWEAYLGALQVTTPDGGMNTMLNVHNPHQCYVTQTWSRYLSSYQLGLGSRGIGFRDSSQDLLAVLASLPAEGKEFIRTLLSFQKLDGSAMHQFNPLTLEGSEGDSVEMEDRPHYYSDDHLWIILAVGAYLREAGDSAFLEEGVPFYAKERQGGVLESGSVLDHLRRGMDFTRVNVGGHGLPLLGFADWNDTVNLKAGAESVFTATLYGRALLEMIALSEHLGDREAARQYRNSYEEMRSHTRACARDGEWFVAYFDEQGRPLGSHENQCGRIFLNAQTWMVISGFALDERGRSAMDAAHKLLNTPYGLKLCAPSFNGYDPAFGGVTTYPPGTKENGGIFLHTNPWAVMAETMLGRGDRAYAYYVQTNPAGHNDRIEIYECEPYVYAQNILGDDHPRFGMGRNSWLTGTASWAYQAATQHILGVRPTFSGLEIDPCIPPHWDGFQVTRRYRGARYHITFKNPEHVSRGIARLALDGTEMAGHILPPMPAGKDHHVHVMMGEERLNTT